MIQPSSWRPLHECSHGACDIVHDCIVYVSFHEGYIVYSLRFAALAFGSIGALSDSRAYVYSDIRALNACEYVLSKSS